MPATRKTRRESSAADILKLWSYKTDAVERECGDVEKAWGPNAEVYRCENCKALYLPTPGESKINVAGRE